MAKVDFSKLQTAVERDTDVTSSAVKAISGLNTTVQDLKQQIADLIANGADNADIQAAVDAFAASFDANTDGIAAAIPANT